VVKSSSKSTKSNNTELNDLKPYTRVCKHIYNKGNRYRVRVSVNGENISVYTKTKKEALRVRQELIDSRVSK
jgi:hypothetical protein